MADLLGFALGNIGALAPVAGGVVNNVISGINQRAARRWEEKMYNEYNSPSALVRQYNEAGINPALMFGGQTPAAPADTSAAPVEDLNTGTLPEVLGQLMQLSMLDEQKENMKLQNSALREEITGRQISNQYSPRMLESQLQSESVRRRLDEAGISESQARASLELSQTLLNNFDAESRQRMNELEARLRIASIAESYQRSAESRARVNEIAANIENIAASTLERTANANRLSQEEKNLLITENILRYDEQAKKFEVDKQHLTWSLNHAREVDALINAPFDFANKFTNVPGRVIRNVFPFAK